MKIATTATLAAALMLSATQPAFSWSSLRCGNGLVTEGDLKLEVLDRCGEPLVTQGNEYIGFHQGWVYEQGNFYYVLTFKGLKLTRIEPVKKSPSMRQMEERAAAWQ